MRLCVLSSKESVPGRLHLCQPLLAKCTASLPMSSPPGVYMSPWTLCPLFHLKELHETLLKRKLRKLVVQRLTPVDQDYVTNKWIQPKEWFTWDPYPLFARAGEPPQLPLNQQLMVKTVLEVENIGRLWKLCSSSTVTGWTCPLFRAGSAQGTDGRVIESHFFFRTIHFWGGVWHGSKNPSSGSPKNVLIQEHVCGGISFVC